MGLASALSTALTGLSGAETTIDVVGNNLANSSTNGFKASTVQFATQFLQTQSLGSAPVGLSGGTDPRQIGLGTQVAAITPDFTQGTIQLTSNPLDLALQGDGFFIVQASSGEQLFTRNGAFQKNASNEIITNTGNKLLGYGVNQNFQLQTTSLQPLTIPQGTSFVAQATENVTLSGSLPPTGNIATTAEIIQSGVLGDSSFAIPPSGALANDAVGPNLAATTEAGSGAGTLNGTFTYKVVFVDANGNESDAATATVAATNAAQIDFTNLPLDASGNYVGRRIYRSTAGQSATFNLAGTINDNTTTSFSDTTTDAALVAQPAFDSSSLTGNYSYFVTWSAPGVPESRPSAPLQPINISDGHVLLSGLPAPSGVYAIPGAKINIYRNTTTQTDTYFRVAQVDPTANPQLAFVDNVPDATISNQSLPNYKVLDQDGPKINTNTLLTDVTSRNGNTYTHPFQAGTLSFTGSKAGSDLSAKSLTITSTSTVQDLIDFVNQALGIQSPASDPSSPIPGDISGQSPGGSVLANGRIQFVGNNGVGNSIAIDSSAFKLTPTAGGNPQTASLGFSSSQAAKGESASTTFQVYDSLGIPLNVRVTSVLQSQTSTETTYRWFADSSNNDPLTGAGTAVGTGLISFDGNGNLITTINPPTVSIDRAHIASDKPLSFKLDFGGVSGLSASTSALNATKVDGSSAGTLTSFQIGEDGTIKGAYSNGVSRTLGQLVLARFANPEGLQARGDNNYSTGVNSGLPVEGAPGTVGIGSVTAGAVELSNTDIGKNLIELILASTAYRGNTRVITTVDQMLQELLSLNR
jgi:flagellar hook protein FlgE